MKKLIVPLGLVLVIGLGSYAIFAQQEQTPDQPQPGTTSGMGCSGCGMMQGKSGGMMGGMNCGGCGMMQGALAATADGGVVVAAGGKLVKYDAALKKVAEVTLETEEVAAPGTMQGCPMMNMMK